MSYCCVQLWNFVKKKNTKKEKRRKKKRRREKKNKKKEEKKKKKKLIHAHLAVKTYTYMKEEKQKEGREGGSYIQITQCFFN